MKQCFTFNILTAAFCVSSCFTMDAAVQKNFLSATNKHLSTEGITLSPKFQSAPYQAPSTDVTVIPDITNAPGDAIIFVGAAGYVNGELVVFGVQDEGDGMILSMPAGTYDFFAYGYTDDNQGTIFMTSENVEISSGSHSVSFNTNDAIYRTDLNLITPDGNDIILPGRPGDINCAIACNYDLLKYDGVFIFHGGGSSHEDSMNYFKGTKYSDKFEFASTAARVTLDGMLCMLLPIDFNVSEITTDSNWQTASTSYVKTPFNLKFDGMIEEMGLDPDAVGFKDTSYSVMDDGDFLVTVGLGFEGAGYDPGKIGIWEPEGYEGSFTFVSYPLGSILAGDESSIQGLPLRRGEKGIEQLGVNMAYGHNLAVTSKGYGFYDSNPFYGGTPTTAVMGNCAPVLVNFPASFYPDFNCMGRYGETMMIDAWNVYDNMEPEGVEVFGLPNQVIVSLNGQVISDDREAFPYWIDWYEVGDYTVDFFTDNILIDSEIPGTTSGTLTFNYPSSNHTLPTATALSFKSKSTGEFTDRFSDASDGLLCMYAAELTFKTVVEPYHYIYYEYETPEEVTVEFAPTGTGDYSTLAIKEIPENFYAPGYGAYYEADLATLDQASESGWYDLKITVIAANGAKQVQEISPAFNAFLVESDVNSIKLSNNNDEVIYFNLQGQKINNPKEGQIVIRKSGSKTEKMVY